MSSRRYRNIPLGGRCRQASLYKIVDTTVIEVFVPCGKFHKHPRLQWIWFIQVLLLLDYKSWRPCQIVTKSGIWCKNHFTTFTLSKPKMSAKGKWAIWKQSHWYDNKTTYVITSMVMLYVHNRRLVVMPEWCVWMAWGIVMIDHSLGSIRNDIRPESLSRDSNR